MKELFVCIYNLECTDCRFVFIHSQWNRLVEGISQYIYQTRRGKELSNGIMFYKYVSIHFF